MDFNLHHFHQRMMLECQSNSLPEDRVNDWSFGLSLGQGPPLPRDVNVHLENTQLWNQFCSQKTEMIITKLGRRMFPSVQVSVEGLDHRARYCILLEIVPSSRRRHKYIGSGESGNSGKPKGWTSAGAAEPQPSLERRLYIHPDSPATGAHWMQHSINFSKLKLTNNALDHHNNIVLTSMHKYVPRIWVIRSTDNVNSLPNLCVQPSASFIFPETEFIAVTAYQNENITKLKIDNNPFAKGFRESGQSRSKRKSDDLSCSQSHGDDEESGVSSSDSESPVDRNKRIMIDTASLDDSGVSSSCEWSPSPSASSIQEVHDHNNDHRPKLHRPWTDSPPPRFCSSSSSSISSSSSSSSSSPSKFRTDQLVSANSITPFSSFSPTTGHFADLYCFPMFYNKHPVFSNTFQFPKYHHYQSENLALNFYR